MRLCTIDGCGRRHTARGFCQRHWILWRKTAKQEELKPTGFQKGDLNPSRDPVRRKEISEWKKGRPQDPEINKRRGLTLSKKFLDPAFKAKWMERHPGYSPSLETRAKISATHSKRPKKMSTWMKKADDIFSLYIRKKYLREDGLVECWSCHKLHPVNEMDCGHFVGRQHKATRFMEENCHPQCRYCNRYIEGNKDAYALSLVKEYGLDILERLQTEKHKIVHVHWTDLESLISKYQQKIRELETMEVMP